MTQASNSTSGVSGAIWNPNAAANWSIVFTPVFGSYLQMLNWRSLGEQGRAEASRRWFYVGLCMLLVYLLIGMLVPDEKAADGAARGLGLVFLVTWYFVSARTQAKYVKAKYGTEYLRQPWGRALLYGVAGIVAYFALAVVLNIFLILGTAIGT